MKTLNRLYELQARIDKNSALHFGAVTDINGFTHGGRTYKRFRFGPRGIIGVENLGSASQAIDTLRREIEINKSEGA